MKSLIKSALSGAALLTLSMSSIAQADGTLPAFPFAGTAFLSGGGAWLEPDNAGQIFDLDDVDLEIASIVGGGDFVIPVTGLWNIQLGGAWRRDETSMFYGSMSNTQFQGGGIGFWRDPTTGLFGIEAGLFSGSSGNLAAPAIGPVGEDTRVISQQAHALGRGGSGAFVKLGGVAEYYFSDMVTIGGFGGVLSPTDSTPFNFNPGFEIDEGFYAGGQVTYYATGNFAVAALARFLELNTSNIGSSNSQQSLHVGGEVRYLTSMSGVEFFAYGGYTSCESETSFQGGQNLSFLTDGAEVMGGIRIHLGGRDSRLVDIDRSNSLDTRAWSCGGGGVALVGDV